jgi:hypothetical protein
MGRRTVALALVAVAALTWRFALHRDPPPRAHGASDFKLPKLVAPPTFEVLSTIDGEILDLGYGFEVTPPAAVEIERLDAHTIRFDDMSHGVMGLAETHSAKDRQHYADPLDAARALARDQESKIIAFETTPIGSYVELEGSLGALPMRQYVVSMHTNKGRVSAWLALFGPAIDSPGGKRLVEELRHGGRISTRQ